MAATTDRQRTPIFDYAASIDPAMSAFGWHFIVLSYLAVLIPLLGVPLPRDVETQWSIVAMVMVVALATIALNLVYLRRMVASDGWEEPPGIVVLTQAVLVTVATGWLNVALSSAAGFYRPIILVPTVLVAVIGNRAMLVTTGVTAFGTLALTTWAQGIETAHLPALLVSYGATWGLLIVMIRLLAGRALQSTTLTQGIADAAAIAAQSDRFDTGLERLLPVIGTWVLADRVTAFESAGETFLPIETWPQDIEACSEPRPELVARARAEHGAAIDGARGLMVATADPHADLSDASVVVVIEGATRAKLDSLTYHFQLTRMADQIQTLLRRSRHIEHLESLGRTDSLTGLPNRRALEERLDEIGGACRHPDGPASLAMIDIDNFKRYNDTHGHPAGDALLRAFASILRSGVRSNDFVARYGGEEFCLLLPATSIEGATQLIEQLRRKVGSAPATADAAFSAGVASWAEAESVEDLMSRADAAMYEAKRSGKARTVSV